MGYAEIREHMVETQLRPEHVSDPWVLSAFKNTPREIFIPKVQSPKAYSDRCVSIGYGRSLLAPTPLARLIQALQILPEDRGLVAPCHTGYTLALMAQRIKTPEKNLVGVDFSEALQSKRSAALANLNLSETMVKILPPHKWIEYVSHDLGTFSVILIEGAFSGPVEPYGALLKEGGRLGMFQPVTSTLDQACLYEKTGGILKKTILFEGKAPFLDELSAPEKFSFSSKGNRANEK